MSKVNPIITGATGMVGKGVLLECLESEKVEKVLVINRSPIGISNPKLKEVILPDFNQIEATKNEFVGYNACFHCMGITSVGMTEKDYEKITYHLTVKLGEFLVSINRDMVFCYVSGAGTDGSETGKTMWARVKGKTENAGYILN